MDKNSTTLTLFSTDVRSLDNAVIKIFSVIETAEVNLSIGERTLFDGEIHQTRKFNFTQMDEKLIERLTRLDLTQNVHTHFRVNK